VLAGGRAGETYTIGGRSEQKNLDVVQMLCTLLDQLCPNDPVVPHGSLIRFVQDRPGHDRRYAIDSRKIEGELGWRPKETFTTGLRKTIQWYLEHEDWVRNITTGAYREWVAKQYSV